MLGLEKEKESFARVESPILTLKAFATITADVGSKDPPSNFDRHAPHAEATKQAARRLTLIPNPNQSSCPTVPTTVVTTDTN